MEHHQTAFTALEQAIERLGTQAAMARICGVSATAVWKWIQDKKPLPPIHVLAVEAATGISRHDLRPDIYPRETVPASPDAGTSDQRGAA